MDKQEKIMCCVSALLVSAVILVQVINIPHKIAVLFFIAGICVVIFIILLVNLLMFFIEKFIHRQLRKKQERQEWEIQLLNTIENVQPVKKILPTDINNCSEYELLSLPGINIAVAKRIIQCRIDIGGFKTKKEFFDFINISPHLQNRIKNFIIIKRLKINKIKKTDERNMDM